MTRDHSILESSKAFVIFPEHYPQPFPLLASPNHSPQLHYTLTPLYHSLTYVSHLLTKEYLTAFDQLTRTMKGEKFYITLTADAVPFCIRTPRSTSFAYHSKLKAELDLLLLQNITPVTQPIEWCAPIVVTPKNNILIFLT